MSKTLAQMNKGLLQPSGERSLPGFISEYSVIFLQTPKHILDVQISFLLGCALSFSQ